MRYSRQILMSDIGKEGQQKLTKAKIAVIGAGGLGCFVLNELVSAGIGNITVIEFDEVSLSNLNRQFIYRESDVGKSKNGLAVEYLNERNSSVSIHGVNERISSDNIDIILSDVDIVVDCVDNIETRMIVNDYCVKNDIPLVEAGVNGFYGFVMSIRKGYPCLRCIGYQNTKLQGENEALGAAVGIVASVEALEVIKIIIGMDDLLYGSMLMIDCRDYSMEKVFLQISEKCSVHHK